MGASERLRLRTRRERRDKTVKLGLGLGFTLKNKEEETKREERERSEEKSLEGGRRLGLGMGSETRRECKCYKRGLYSKLKRRRLVNINSDIRTGRVYEYPPRTDISKSENLE